ncbi:MAG: hypothetical protein IJ661_09380 [Lachnospiraceae bacterium]|nr:hypothetical protein [Lachnospiraceae bacterium]
MLVHIYRGEGRMLIIPITHCCESEWFVNLQSPEKSNDVGKAILDATEYIKDVNDKFAFQQNNLKTPVWKLNSKYRSRVSFVKRNNNGYVLYSDDEIKVCSVLKSEEFAGQYGDICKEIKLSIHSDVEEIGAAVINVMDAVDEYYADNKTNSKKFKELSVELLNKSILKIVEPQDKHFLNFDDYGAAELYKCYCYVSRDGAESSAEIFLGIAPELDCNLEKINIYNAWKGIHGVADYFDVQVVENGIFNMRAEMKNSGLHKISYYKQVEDDLLLECGIEVHQPNKRKKLDDKLTQIFEIFSLNCKSQ